jgi:elongation factor 1-gamma
MSSNSNSPILYTYKRCFTSKLISVIKSFTGAALDVVHVDTLGESNIKKIVDKSPTGQFPVLQDGEFFLSGTLSITKYLLAENETIYNILYGKELKKRALNDSWIDYTSFNVWPFYDEIIGQITGKLDAHDNLFSTAIGDLMQVLVKINKHLTFRTFLVDHTVSLADVVLATALYPYFTLVLDEKLRDNIPNVLRWFLFVSNIKEVSQALGKARLCFKTSQPSIAPMLTLTAPIQTKKPTQDTKTVPPKKDEKKPAPKTENKPVEKKPKENDDGEEETSGGKKPTNPLELLPPSTFQLDPFKKEFLNTKEKKAVLEKFWNEYDPTGYSLWFTHYNRSGDQGKVDFMTVNLLQKLEKFRRYTFSAFGVYGTVPNLEVEGVWMWRGLDIPQEMKEHDSFDFVTFKKLDPVTDRKFIEEFWLNL